VKTYAGQQDVSRQRSSGRRWSTRSCSPTSIADYFTKLDLALLAAPARPGAPRHVRRVGDRHEDVHGRHADAAGALPEGRRRDPGDRLGIYRPATTIVMHPRRWGWATAQLDSSNRPLVVPNAQGPFNALAVGDAPEYGAVVGTMQGLPVITDANITTTNGAGTNEDQIFVERMPELLFWQEGDGTPRQFRFEQSARRSRSASRSGATRRSPRAVPRARTRSSPARASSPRPSNPKGRVDHDERAAPGVQRGPRRRGGEHRGARQARVEPGPASS
jgi:hypothetical protein